MDMETHVGVQAQTWGHPNREVREETHKERRERGDGRGRGDKVPLHISDTREVNSVVRAAVVGGANARPS